MCRRRPPCLPSFMAPPWSMLNILLYDSRSRRIQALVTTSSALKYMQAASAILERIATTQLDAIGQAAELCANAIANDGLVHCFGTGHSRIPVEELFPRHGSFPGFHPIAEL